MLITGTLQTRDYEHFTVGEHAFEGAKAAGRALPGDKVLLDTERGLATMVERTKHVLVGTLELNSKTRYGMTSHGVPLFLFQPFDESYPPFYVGSKERDLTRPQLCIVTFDSWEVGSACPRGFLSHGLLGPAGDSAVEKRALLLHYGGVFKQEKITPSAIVKYVPADGDRQFYTVSIDPEGCRDIDDALTITKSNDGWFVEIHIADVGFAVTREPWLFDYARRRGQTFYDAGKAVRPMLPSEYSEGVCSLLQGQARPVITLSFDVTFDGKIHDETWSESVIIVKKNHTYESVLSDPKFDSEPLRLVTGSADSHAWVEWAMLFYNRKFAEKLCGATPGILRRHATPDAEKLALYEGVLAEEDLSWLAFKSAEYCWGNDTDTQHWSLGADKYCHATSPIRRFADLYNQLVFRKSHIAGAYDITELNAQARAAKRFDRDCAFVDAVLSEEKTVDVIPLPGEKMWVAAWRQVVRAPPGLETGVKTTLEYYADPTKRSWKRRIVFRVK
jgi:exoribonuclease R